MLYNRPTTAVPNCGRRKKKRLKTEKAVDFIQSTPYIPPVKTDEEQLSAPLDSPQIKSLSQIADLLRQHKKLLLAFGVENYIRPIKIEESVLTCAFSEGAPPTLGRDLTNFLKETTRRLILSIASLSILLISFNKSASLSSFI